MDTLDWLLESDPAIRWQAMRDLTITSAEALGEERAVVSRQGIGAKILAHQLQDGSWRRDDAPAWLTTLFTLQLLRATGIDPADSAVQGAMERLEAGVRWNDLGGCWELRPPETGGNTFFQGEEEPCINGGALAAGAYFGRPEGSLARRLLAEQLGDGGWNCAAPKSCCSSFHTTICVLEGLLEYERATGSTTEIRPARQRAEEYLLRRGLFRRLSTGEIVDAEFLACAFPPRYHYDILRALDYFRATGEPADPRVAEAVRMMESKRQQDGRWLLDAQYDEGIAVASCERTGEPSRWNTLRAMRVLRWFEGAGAPRMGQAG